MGFDAYMGLSVGCLIPLTAKNWPKLRRLFANPRVQSAIQCGGASVLYPCHSRPSASAAASESSESAGGAAASAADSINIAAAAASHAMADACIGSDQDVTFKSKFEVNVLSTDRHGTSYSTELYEYVQRNSDLEVNATMREFFRKLPGFDTDDGASLTAADHEAALAAFASYGSSASDEVEALLFEFPLLDQSIGARGQNYESMKHMRAATLGTQLALAESQLASFGFAREEIHVRTHMSCC